MDTPNDLTPRVLEALCHRALGHDIEFTSSGFWQAQLQSQFKLEDGFFVLCEQSPDKNDRTRIDQMVFCLRPTGLVAQLCLVEGKRRGAGTKHIAGAEMQAYKGASTTLDFTGDHIVHIMTSWGICFRTWELEIGGRKLVPLNGGPDIPGHRNSYLDIRNPSHNATFNNFVLAVKKQALGKQGAQHTGQLGAGDGDAGGYVDWDAGRYADGDAGGYGDGDAGGYADADAQGYADVGAGGSNTGGIGVQAMRRGYSHR